MALENLRSRAVAYPDTFYRAVMPHSEICIHMGIAGRVMKFRIDLDDKVYLYDPERGSQFGGPILPSEAGLFQVEGENYFYPAPTQPIKGSVWIVAFTRPSDNKRIVKPCKTEDDAFRYAAEQAFEIERLSGEEGDTFYLMNVARHDGNNREVLRVFESAESFRSDSVEFSITEEEIYTEK